MSVVNGVYEAPDWKDGQPPAISAEELRAIAQALTGQVAIPNPVFSGSISMGRYPGITVGENSTALGNQVSASGKYSHAEGKNARAQGQYSHAEGNYTTASGESSHTEGDRTTASGTNSHAEGDRSSASGAYSHAEGYVTKSQAFASHSEGSLTIASADYSHAEGRGTTASNYSSHAQGMYNKPMEGGGTGGNLVGDAMVIGNGMNEQSLSNAFRITRSGAVYGVGSFHTSGADYAEYFEWADGNPNAEDRVGRFVTLEGDRLKLAGPGDYLLGIVSGNPCIVGNGDEDWLGRWVHDEFDRFVKEYLEEDREPLDIPEGLSDEERLALITAPDVREENGQYYRITSRVVDYETPSWRLKANPAYDPSQPYVERRDRQEWDTVGMLGVLAVRDDGTCQVNGFCQVAEGGVATAAEGYVPGLTYRVIDRVSDKVVKVVFR